MLIVGLTGGLASGKSFVASCFRRLKIPIFDADLEVHKLLLNDHDIFNKISSSFPQSIIENKIDRKIISKNVFDNRQKLAELEQIIYPALKKKEALFIKNCRKTYQKLAILNTPLLFEKGGYRRCHVNIAVITSPQTQLLRFKNRKKPTSDLELVYKEFCSITKHQTNNLTRKKLADLIINNGLGKSFTFRQVKSIVWS
jgi:dephospho-CoA kinase